MLGLEGFPGLLPWGLLEPPRFALGPLGLPRLRLWQAPILLQPLLSACTAFAVAKPIGLHPLPRGRTAVRISTQVLLVRSLQAYFSTQSTCVRMLHATRRLVAAPSAVSRGAGCSKQAANPCAQCTRICRSVAPVFPGVGVLTGTSQALSSVLATMGGQDTPCASFLWPLAPQSSRLVASFLWPLARESSRCRTTDDWFTTRKQVQFLGPVSQWAPDLVQWRSSSHTPDGRS